MLIKTLTRFLFLTFVFFCFVFHKISRASALVVVIMCKRSNQRSVRQQIQVSKIILTRHTQMFLKHINNCMYSYMCGCVCNYGVKCLSSLHLSIKFSNSCPLRII